jgi:hypothetical protein
MKYLLFVFITIVGCAPLNPHATSLGKTGEAIGRTILCPLTLCLSEVGFAENYKNEQKRLAYEQWRMTLTEAEQLREDRRQAEASRSLAIALSWRPALIRPHIMPTQPGHSSLDCATNQAGDSFYTTCR